jgi:Cu-Zn family superoxide dismutase
MRTTLAFVLAAALAGGCGSKKPAPAEPTGGSAASDATAEMAAKPKSAVATMVGTKGHESVKGTVEFMEMDGAVMVTAKLEGLTPGDHGFHIHEKGDCSAPDGASAGGHFNPSGHPHAGPDAAAHHEGDLGNLTAGADGKAEKTIHLKDVTLGDGANSVIGKGFIIHDKADDLTTQPTGNAGARVACGVITAQ